MWKVGLCIFSLVWFVKKHQKQLFLSSVDNYIGKVLLWCFFMSGKNPQNNFSSQNLCIKRIFFKWNGKVTKNVQMSKNEDFSNTLDNSPKSRAGFFVTEAILKFGLSDKSLVLGILVKKSIKNM